MYNIYMYVYVYSRNYLKYHVFQCCENLNLVLIGILNCEIIQICNSIIVYYINMQYNQIFISTKVKKNHCVKQIRRRYDRRNKHDFFSRSSSSFSTKRHQSFLIRSELDLSLITAWFPGSSSLYNDYCTVSIESV